MIFQHKRQYIADNWPNMKCKPFAAPFAGFIRNETGLGVVEAGIKNVFGCVWLQIKAFFALLMKPFRFIIDIVHRMLKMMAGVMDVFRQQMAVIRQFLSGIMQSVMGRLENLAATFVNIFYRLRDMMNRSFATFKMLTYILETITLTMKSMNAGPVGTMLRFSGDIGYVATYFLLGPFAFLAWPELWSCVFCFASQTPVTMEDGSRKCISDIKLGDKTSTGEVTGVLHFWPKEAYLMYTNGTDLVTGGHRVLSQTGEWIPVSAHPDYIPEKLCQDDLYCLATDTHRIKTPVATYLDWEETDDLDQLVEQKSKALRALSSAPSLDPDHLYQEGFWLINQKACDQLQMQNIYGKGIWQIHPDVKWYRLTSITNPTYLVTGSTLVHSSKGWHQVAHDIRFEVVALNTIEHVPTQITHYQSASGTIILEGMVYRDLLEDPNPSR